MIWSLVENEWSVDLSDDIEGPFLLKKVYFFKNTKRKCENDGGSSISSRLGHDIREYRRISPAQRLNFVVEKKWVVDV